MKLGILANATRADLALAVVATTAVECLCLLALGHNQQGQAAELSPEVSWSVPVKLEQVEAPPPAPEAPKLINPRIKLGGGKPGGSVRRRPGATPHMPRPLPPPPTTAQRPQVIAAPPGPTTSAPLPTLEPPVETAEALRDDQDYDAEPGDEASDAPPGEGFPDGEPDGTITDPLQAHAIRLYRARVQAWFAQRFKVTGSGLPQSTLRKLRAGASISVDSSRRVSGFSTGSSGNAKFDAAVRRALDAVRGLEIPPPPQHYPGALQGQINVTFVCGENTCD